MEMLMRLFSRLGLFAVMVVSSFTFLTETADAQLFPIFKCRKKACCCKPAEPAPEPEPVCCPAPEPEPEPVCCPEPAPEPEPVCCPEPAPAPVCCAVAEPVEAPAEPEPAPVAEPCCCGTVVSAPATAEASPEASPEVAEYGMPELAEGEVLLSISPIEVPTDDGTSTLTSGEAK